MNTNGSKQRLKPWLIDQIESGKYLGLHWIDRNRKIFQIPWKRNGTSEWEEKYSAIFKEWAKHKGKYREGDDKTDYPSWKATFRCALNKHEEFNKIKDSNIEEENSYRVYQIQEISTKDEPLPTEDNDVEMVEVSQPLTDLDNGFHGFSFYNHFPPTVDNKELYYPPSTENQMSLGSMDAELKNISNSQLIQLPSEESRKLKELLQHSDHKFQVIIKFYGTELKKDFVEQLCLLTTQPISNLNGCKVIGFPDILVETKEVQKLVSSLWPNLEGGVSIKVDENNNILVLRNCKCRIYYCSQNIDSNGSKLNREEWTVVFNYQNFLQDLKNDYPPPTELDLYFGQKPEPNQHTFFSITIQHLEALEILKRMPVKKPLSVSM